MIEIVRTLTQFKLSGKLLRLCISLTLVIASNSLYGQLDNPRLNYAGKDFWFTSFDLFARGPFRDYNWTDSDAVRSEFYITGSKDANITFTYKKRNNKADHYFFKGGTVMKIVPTAWDIHSIETWDEEAVDSASLHITSDEPVVINFANTGNYIDDGILLFPTDNQNSDTT